MIKCYRLILFLSVLFIPVSFLNLKQANAEASIWACQRTGAIGFVDTDRRDVSVEKIQADAYQSCRRNGGIDCKELTFLLRGDIVVCYRGVRPTSVYCDNSPTLAESREYALLECRRISSPATCTKALEFISK